MLGPESETRCCARPPLLVCISKCKPIRSNELTTPVALGELGRVHQVHGATSEGEPGHVVETAGCPGDALQMVQSHLRSLPLGFMGRPEPRRDADPDGRAYHAQIVLAVVNWDKDTTVVLGKLGRGDLVQAADEVLEYAVLSSEGKEGQRSVERGVAHRAQSEILVFGCLAFALEEPQAHDHLHLDATGVHVGGGEELHVLAGISMRMARWMDSMLNLSLTFHVRASLSSSYPADVTYSPGRDTPNVTLMSKKTICVLWDRLAERLHTVKSGRVQ